MVSGDRYEVQVLGKNGEPKPYCPEAVTLQHAHHGSFTANLTTDEKGKLYLGQLT